jgi:acyl-CoA reductase-like NAD-dependent aldehyde dehydrogenase
MRSNYINGIWTPSAGDAGIDVVNPATEKVIDVVPAGHPADVDAAFGGFGQSGYGRELGVPGLEEFLEIKALQF